MAREVRETGDYTRDAEGLTPVVVRDVLTKQRQAHTLTKVT